MYSPSVCFDLTPLSPCSLYVTFPPAPPKATYIFFGDKSMSPNPTDSVAVVRSQGRATLSPPPLGAHVLKAAASKRSRVRGLSRTWFNPPVPFALQCLGTFPLFNPHFPRDMRISISPPPLTTLCPSHCCQTHRSLSCSF